MLGNTGGYERYIGEVEQQPQQLSRSGEGEADMQAAAAGPMLLPGTLCLFLLECCGMCSYVILKLSQGQIL